jgi:soluble lytic murein transglycosylase-like protein
VDACRFEGDTAVLTMPGGGEIRVGRGIVEALTPEDVPRLRTGAVSAGVAPPATATTPAPLSRQAIRALVDEIAAKIGLDPRLAHAVVVTESNYEPRAVSPRGAIGLMQIMPALVREYGVADPFDPRHNLEAGLRHLSGLLRRFDIRHALAAYNAGEGAVARYGGIPPYRETQNYVRRILAAIR